VVQSIKIFKKMLLSQDNCGVGAHAAIPTQFFLVLSVMVVNKLILPFVFLKYFRDIGFDGRC
jgi:hypothetical protein